MDKQKQGQVIGIRMIFIDKFLHEQGIYLGVERMKQMKSKNIYITTQI